MVSGDPVRALVPLDASPADMKISRSSSTGQIHSPSSTSPSSTGSQSDLGSLSDTDRNPAAGPAASSHDLLLLQPPFNCPWLSRFHSGFTAVRKDTVLDHLGTTLSLQEFPSRFLGRDIAHLFLPDSQVLPPSGKDGLSHLVLPAVANSLR